MIRVVFKNLEPSVLAKNMVGERMEPIMTKFPNLARHRMTVYLSKQDSSHRPGPDLFSARVRVDGRLYRGISLEKASSNLFQAVSELKDSLTDTLKRMPCHFFLFLTIGGFI